MSSEYLKCSLIRFSVVFEGLDGYLATTAIKLLLMSFNKNRQTIIAISSLRTDSLNTVY